MIKFSTEYLILHENEINWEELSSDKDEFFSIVEVRLFRSKINWKQYLINHSEYVNTQILEIASKYFTKEIYEILAAFNITTEDFLKAHPEKFDFQSVIQNCEISEETLLQTKKYWDTLPNLKELFYNSKYIKIEDPEYSSIKLMLETE